MYIVSIIKPVRNAVNGFIDGCYRFRELFMRELFGIAHQMQWDGQNALFIGGLGVWEWVDFER